MKKNSYEFGNHYAKGAILNHIKLYDTQEDANLEF